MDGTSAKDYAIAAAVVVGLVVLVTILNKAGLLGTNPDKKAAEALKRMPEFRNDYAKKFIAAKKQAGMTEQQVKDRYAPGYKQLPNIALAISSSHKPFNWKELLKLTTPVAWPFVDVDDDEQKVYGAFGKLNTKLELGLLSFVFQRMYSLNLINFLSEWMSTGELAEVYKIVKELK